MGETLPEDCELEGLSYGDLCSRWIPWLEELGDSVEVEAAVRERGNISMTLVRSFSGLGAVFMHQ